MKPYAEMSLQELEEQLSQEAARYEDLKGRGMNLNIARGKPSKAQLALSEGLFSVILSSDDCFDGDIDCRNYGELTGIPSAKKLMGELMGASADQVIVGGCSSLSLMYDNISRSFTTGICGNTPWSKLDKVKFLCPVPGYDRHFAITEHFGVEMINIPMHEDGPDMDMVEELVNTDPAVKGIWCVPKYSNPQGITYSDEVVRRFANLKPAAPDFRIYWDNAYGVHWITEFEDPRDSLLNILEESKKAGNPDIVFMFASTSKITFAGAGISAIASSENNIEDMKNWMNYMIISYDKLNMLRHVKFFKDLNGIKEHMKKHAVIMNSKFRMVDEVFARELDGLGILDYNIPRGGYFISVETLPGCAAATVKMAKEAGLTLTGAGSSFPYHRDPKDTNIRIAPSMPGLDELEKAAELFAVCVKVVSLKKLIAER